MPSNSLLKNKYFDKLSLNRLKVNSLKVNKLFENKHDCSCKSISYLFSLDLQKASWNSETNELTFSKGDALSLLRFTDRPYQFDKIFKDSDAVEYLDILFRSNPNGINSCLLINSSSAKGTGEIAPIPPVFNPISPSPILL